VADLSRRTGCRLCASRDLERVVPMPATAIADAYVSPEQRDQKQALYPLDLYFCRTCTHVQLLHVVDPRLMFKSDYTYASGSSAGIVRHFGEHARALIEREKPSPGALVVDVGSNDGTFLRFFKEAGLAVLGVDPATELARQAARSGIETVTEFLDPSVARRLRSEHGPARIVTANNVFAHADDLAGMADSIRILLDEDGLFAFEVSYLLDIVDHMLLGTIFHEHLSYHTVRALRRFLAAHDLELVDVTRNTIQGGSLVGFAQPRGGRRPVSPRVDDLLRLEEERRLHDPETLRQFDHRLERMKQDVKQLFAGIAAEGKTVAGFGAARGGTTLLYRLDIGEDIRFIVDDSPAKQGLLTPGHHIPVLATSALYERRPEYVFILAWVHAKPIQQNHRRYVEEGGRFVLAVPEIRVVTAADLPGA